MREINETWHVRGNGKKGKAIMQLESFENLFLCNNETGWGKDKEKLKGKN